MTSPAPDTGRTAEEMLDDLDRANTVTEPQRCADLMDEARLAIIALRAENANLRDRVREAEGAAEVMRERCAREAERVVKVPARMIGGMRVERLPMAPRTPREIAAAIRDLPSSDGYEASDPPRCTATGNPCGTDTVMASRQCPDDRWGGRCAHRTAEAAKLALLTQEEGR